MKEKGLRRYREYLYKNGFGQWLLASIMTLAVLAFVMSFTQVTFLSDDDYVLMGCLNGTLSGSPTFFCSYTNPIFSYLLSGLYTLTLAVNWYVLYHYVILITAVATVGRCILRICNRRELAFWKPVVIFLWLLIGVFLYPISTISFTLTAVIACTASVALILTVDPTLDSHKEQLLDYILCVLFSFFGYILRSLSAAAVLCFLALAFAYRIARLRLDAGTFKSREMRRISVCALAVIVLIAGATYAKQVEERYYSDFNEFNYARSLYMDYPRAPFSEMREEYEARGMNEELVNILNQWFFADERIDAQTLRELAQIGGKQESRSVGKAIHTGVYLVKTNKFVLSGLLICIFLGIAGVYFATKETLRKKYWPELLTAVCAALGAGLQCFILCWVGRFLMQVFLSSAIPCTISLVLLLLLTVDNDFLRFGLPMRYELPPNDILSCIVKYGRSIVIVLTFCAMLLTCYKPMNYVFNHDIKIERVDSLVRVRAFYQYVTSHPQNNYMYDAASKYDVDAFPENINLSRYNAIAWGDSFYHSPVYDAQVARMGREEFYADTLLEDDVYFISDPRESSISGMLLYMCEKYDVIALKVVDTIEDDLKVYDFMKLKFADHYTGWLEEYGRRYYVKNGKIQTGWFKVDGKTYYGIPTGSDEGNVTGKKEKVSQRLVNYSISDKKINGEEYSLCTGKSAAIGMMFIDGETYFFDANGTMQTGWVYISHLGWCYFQENGQMTRDDWVEKDGYQYFFNINGALFYAIPAGEADVTSYVFQQPGR